MLQQNTIQAAGTLENLIRRLARLTNRNPDVAMRVLHWS